MAALNQEQEFENAIAGFDALFSNDLDGAKNIFGIIILSTIPESD